MKKYFLIKFNLPNEFNFARYITLFYKSYIAELGEISPLTWFIIACFLILNVIKIYSSNSNSCYQIGPTSKECIDAIISYGITSNWILLFLFCIVYLISGIFMDKLLLLSYERIFEKFDSNDLYYYHRLLISFSDMDTLDMHNTSSKSLIQDNEDNEDNNANTGTDGNTNQDSGITGRTGIRATSYTNDDNTSYMNEDNTGTTSYTMYTKGNIQTRSRKLTLLSNITYTLQEYHDHFQKITILHSQQDDSSYSFNECFRNLVYSCKQVPLPHYTRNKSFSPKNYFQLFLKEIALKALHRHKDNDSAVLHIFYYQWISHVYFFIIRLCLTFQCMFISVTCTQLFPIATLYNKTQEVKSIIIILIPIVLNCFIISWIFKRAILLKVMCKLDYHLISKVIEEEIFELDIIEEIHISIRDKLEEYISLYHPSLSINYQSTSMNEISHNHVVHEESIILKVFSKRFLKELDIIDSCQLITYEGFRSLMFHLKLYIPLNQLNLIWDNLLGSKVIVRDSSIFHYYLYNRITYYELIQYLYNDNINDFQSEQYLIEELKKHVHINYQIYFPKDIYDITIQVNDNKNNIQRMLIDFSSYSETLKTTSNEGLFKYLTKLEFKNFLLNSLKMECSNIGYEKCYYLCLDIVNMNHGQYSNMIYFDDFLSLIH